VPATEQAKIGGDWYDALQLSEDRVLVAIGDVTGHGIEAVIAMNKARQLLISYALIDATPAGVLERVNFDLVRGKSPLITAICGIIDTRTREFAYGCAGHPPPVVVEPRGHAKLLDFGSLPLGVAAKADYRTSRMQLAPGAMLVLYTDGLIEHSRDLALGEAALLEAAEAVAGLAGPEPAEEIRDRIFRDRKVGDDVAILTVRFAENSAGANSTRRIA
jgi:serine phosphatase RsbU (regulator of sigma subunit)